MAEIVVTDLSKTIQVDGVAVTLYLGAHGYVRLSRDVALSDIDSMIAVLTAAKVELEEWNAQQAEASAKKKKFRY